MRILGRTPVELAIWVAALVFLGWILPSWMGVGSANPLLHLTYAGLTVLFAAPLVVDRAYVDPKRARHHVIEGVRFALLSFLLLMLIDGIRGGRFPAVGHGVRVTLLALAFAIFGAGLAATLGSRVTRARTAKQTLRTGFLLLLAIVVYAWRRYGAGLDFLLMDLVSPGGDLAPVAIACAVLMGGGVLMTRAAAKAD